MEFVRREMSKRNMKCEEFRQSIDGAPADNFDGREAHLESCEACADYAGRAQSFEQLIVQALNVPVPDAIGAIRPESESNVVELHTGRAPSSMPALSYAWLGLAAGVVLAVFVGFRLSAPLPDVSARSQLLASEVLSHMNYEAYSRQVTTKPAAFEQVDSVTRTADVAVSDDLGLISYAMSCEINGNTIPHLVVQGKYGPVTILILPEEPIDRAIALDNADYHGSIIPVGDGSVAIIGRKGEPIDEIRNKVDNAIRLSI